MILPTLLYLCQRQESVLSSTHRDNTRASIELLLRDEYLRLLSLAVDEALGLSCLSRQVYRLPIQAFPVAIYNIQACMFERNLFANALQSVIDA